MIKVNNVSKSFGEVKALRKIDFTIEEGEIFGLLGPNGAGKSTTINIINTLLQPDRGEVKVGGMDIASHKNQCKQLIGVVPQEIALYGKLSAYENLMFWGSLYEIPQPELRKRAEEVLKRVGLSERKNDSIDSFSGGMKRRINIASSILHKPKILLMDEPTVGVDPQSRNHVFEVIEQLNKEGMTIIYTTHYMEEAERLCDTIAIIDEGKIIAKGSLEQLRNSSGSKDVLHIKLDAQQLDLSALKVSHKNLSLNPETGVLSIECNELGTEISDLITQIRQAGVSIQSIDTQQVTLESIFLKLTGKRLRD